MVQVQRFTIKQRLAEGEYTNTYIDNVNDTHIEACALGKSLTESHSFDETWTVTAK